jgi:hypothetical protein
VKLLRAPIHQSPSPRWSSTRWRVGRNGSTNKATSRRRDSWPRGGNAPPPITSGPAHARSCLARRGRLRRCACRAAAHRRTNARPRQCRRRLCLDLVLQADWPRAWQAFDVRFQFPDVVPTVTLTRKDGSTYAPQPWSQGPPPASLLVMGEQGLGDTIQFVRFLPQLAATGCKVPASSRGPCWVCSSRLSGRSTFSPCRRPGAE